MRQWLRKFTDHVKYEQHVDQVVDTDGTAAMEDTVSWCRQELHVHYDPIPHDARLTCVYMVEDATNPVKLLGSVSGRRSFDDGNFEIVPPMNKPSNFFDEVDIDGIPQDMDALDQANGQVIMTIGRHVVKFTMKDPTCILARMWNYTKEIVQVHIPNTVKYIGESVFASCAITDVYIPSSVEYIGEYAFAWCENNGRTLTKAEISNGCQIMGGFGYSENLTEFKIPSSVKYLGGETYAGMPIQSVTIPEGVEAIGVRIQYDNWDSLGCTFYDMPNLSEVHLPQSLKVLGRYEFDDCPSLPVIDGIRYADTCLVEVVDKTRTTYTIRPGTKFISNIAFTQCAQMTSITIPEGVVQIMAGAFRDLTSLQEVHLPSTIEFIEYNVFDGCTALPVIDGIRYADTCLVEVVDKTRTTYTIRPGTRIIHNMAFRNCTAMTSITIPDTVVNIGEDVFNGCVSLESIHIPASVKVLGYWHHYDYQYVSFSGSYLFGDCESLTQITVDPNNPYYDSRDNCNAIIITALDALIDGCKTTTIPSSVKIVHDLYPRCSIHLNDSLSLPEGVERCMIRIRGVRNGTVGVSTTIENLLLPSTLCYLDIQCSTNSNNLAGIRLKTLTVPENVKFVYIDSYSISIMDWIRFTGPEPPVGYLSVNQSKPIYYVPQEHYDRYIEIWTVENPSIISNVQAWSGS